MLVYTFFFSFAIFQFETGHFVTVKVWIIISTEELSMIEGFLDIFREDALFYTTSNQHQCF